MFGKIIKIQSDKLALVEIICKEDYIYNKGHHCGACNKAPGKMQKTILAKNKINANLGDEVTINLEEGGATKSAALLLLLPLLVFLLTTGIVTALNMESSFIFLISFISIVITLAGVKVFTKNKTYYVIVGAKGRQSDFDNNSST